MNSFSLILLSLCAFGKSLALSLIHDGGGYALPYRIHDCLRLCWMIGLEVLYGFKIAVFSLVLLVGLGLTEAKPTPLVFRTSWFFTRKFSGITGIWHFGFVGWCDILALQNYICLGSFFGVGLLGHLVTRNFGIFGRALGCFEFNFSFTLFGRCRESGSSTFGRGCSETTASGTSVASVADASSWLGETSPGFSLSAGCACSSSVGRISGAMFAVSDPSGRGDASAVSPSTGSASIRRSLSLALGSGVLSRRIFGLYPQRLGLQVYLEWQEPLQEQVPRADVRVSVFSVGSCDSPFSEKDTDFLFFFFLDFLLAGSVTSLSTDVSTWGSAAGAVSAATWSSVGLSSDGESVRVSVASFNEPAPTVSASPNVSVGWASPD
ncbi:hypothetical protein HG531_001618 [Fusarium graminearum]|nr:hypothetical protein HG531_001618 [Fusarium graminearum]